MQAGRAIIGTARKECYLRKEKMRSASRFLAGLPHGAYFGVASLLAARIMGPGRQGAGSAVTPSILLSG